MMKSKLSYILGLLGMFMSCSVPDLEVVIGTKPDKMVVKAVISDQTKTYMGPEDENSRKVMWTKGDRILLTYGFRKAVFKADEGGAPYTTFTQETEKVNLDFTKGLMAGYPSDAFLGIIEQDEQIELEIPSIQGYKDDSFCDNVMPMLSNVAYKPEFKFRNIAGVLRLLVSTEIEGLSVNKITLTADKPLSGVCGYMASEDKYYFDEYLKWKKSVVLKVDEGVQIGSNEVPFNIVVPHQKYEEMTITIGFTDGTEQLYVMKDGLVIDVKRASITNIPLKVTKTVATVQPQVSLECTSYSFDTFSIAMTVTNTDSYFCGLTTASNYNEQDVMWALLYQSPYTTNLNFRGRITNIQSDFSEYMFVPGETYIFWVVPTNNLGIYDESDIRTIEVKTKFYTPGSSVAKINGIENISTATNTIQFTMNASGYFNIYCQLVRGDKLSGYSEKDKIDLLILPGNTSAKYEPDSELSYYEQNLKPGFEYKFLALPIDNEGYYGNLFEQSISTVQLDYNDLIVSIDKSESSLPSVNWSVTGGTAKEYVYFLSETDGNRWINVMESSIRTVQEKIYQESALYYFYKVKSPSATLSLTKGVEYVFVLVAMDDEGRGSVADSWIFTY